MSPEQALGQMELLQQTSDVYSLGATLYYLLTGTAPLADCQDVGLMLQRVTRGDIPAPCSINASVHPTLEAICRKAMAVKPEDRYPSADDVAQDIQSWLADEPMNFVKESRRFRLARGNGATERGRTRRRPLLNPPHHGRARGGPGESTPHGSAAEERRIEASRLQSLASRNEGEALRQRDAALEIARPPDLRPGDPHFRELAAPAGVHWLGARIGRSRRKSTTRPRSRFDAT